MIMNVVTLLVLQLQTRLKVERRVEFMKRGEEEEEREREQEKENSERQREFVVAPMSPIEMGQKDCILESRRKKTTERKRERSHFHCIQLGEDICTIACHFIKEGKEEEREKEKKSERRIRTTVEHDLLFTLSCVSLDH